MPTLPTMLRFAATMSVIGIAVTDGGLVNPRSRVASKTMCWHRTHTPCRSWSRQRAHFGRCRRSARWTSAKAVHNRRPSTGYEGHFAEGTHHHIRGGQSRFFRFAPKSLPIITIGGDVDLGESRRGYGRRHENDRSYDGTSGHTLLRKFDRVPNTMLETLAKISTRLVRRFFFTRPLKFSRKGVASAPRCLLTHA